MYLIGPLLTHVCVCLEMSILKSVRFEALCGPVCMCRQICICVYVWACVQADV